MNEIYLYTYKLRENDGEPRTISAIQLLLDGREHFSYDMPLILGSKHEIIFKIVGNNLVVSTRRVMHKIWEPKDDGIT